jgi:hypothetical protein
LFYQTTLSYSGLNSVILCLSFSYSGLNSVILVSTQVFCFYMRYFVLPPGVHLHYFDAAATPQTPLRRLTHLFKATDTPQPPEPLYRTNKTLLSIKYINTSFKGYKRHFPPKSQFLRAGLQAKHIGHL